MVTLPSISTQQVRPRGDPWAEPIEESSYDDHPVFGMPADVGSGFNPPAHRAGRPQRCGPVVYRDAADLAPPATRARSARPAGRPHAEGYRPHPRRGPASQRQAVLEGIMSTLHASSFSRRIWARTTQALGKLWAGVISLPDRPSDAARHDFQDY